MSQDEMRDLLRRAYALAARESDDPDTNNGAVLVDRYGSLIGESANVFPDGVSVTAERQQRPTKYSYMVHAERGAIYKAARSGLQAKGGMLVVPWYACADCAQAIIQAGVVRVVGHRQMLDATPDRWKETIVLADAMLDEAGVVRDYYDGPIGDVTIKFNGGDWSP